MAKFGLVHGAWHGAWCWERLIPELEARGHGAVAMDLPCDDPDATFEDYATAVVDALANVREPVILVGHSLGGVTIPIVAARRPLARLVYLCAVLHPALVPPGSPRPHAPGTFAALDRAADGSHRWPSRAAAQPVMYGQCTPEDVDWAFARLRRQHTARAWAAVPVPDPWPRVPVSSILCESDRAVRPEWSRWAAATVLDCPDLAMPGDHSPFLSRPALLADLLARLAEPVIPAATGS